MIYLIIMHRCLQERGESWDRSHVASQTSISSAVYVQLHTIRIKSLPQPSCFCHSWTHTLDNSWLKCATFLLLLLTCTETLAKYCLPAACCSIFHHFLIILLLFFPPLLPEELRLNLKNVFHPNCVKLLRYAVNKAGIQLQSGMLCHLCSAGGQQASFLCRHTFKMLIAVLIFL